MPTYSAGKASILLEPSIIGFVAKAKAKLAALKDIPLKIELEAQTTRAELSVKAFRAAAGRDLDVKVTAGTGRATAAMAAWRAEQQSNSVGMRVHLDQTSAAKARSDHANLVQGLFRRPLSSPITVAVGVVGAPAAVASLLSVADAILKVSQSAALIPAISFAGLVGAGAATAGIAGIPATFKALTAVGKEATTSANSHRDAIVAVSEAQLGIAEAQRGVVAADREARQAQVDLTDSYRDSSRAIRDMNADLESQKLSARGAALSVKEAAQRLAEVQRDPRADALTRERAQLSYEEAVARLKDQTNKTADAAQDTARANAKGVEGSKQVVSAKQAVADSAAAEVKAHHDVTKSVDALTKAQAALRTGTSADATLAQTYAKLSPNAKILVEDIQSLGPAITDLRQQSQDALTFGLGADIKRLAETQLPTLTKGFVDVDTAFNSGLRASLAELSTNTNRVDFKTSLDNVASGFGNAAKSAGPLTDAVTKLITVGSTFLPHLGDQFASVTERFNEFIQKAAADGSLERWIQEGITSTGQLFRTIGNIGSAISSVFDAASVGGTGLKGLEDATQRMENLLKSAAGQGDLREFFRQAREEGAKWKPVLADLPGIVHAITEGIRTWADIMMPFLTTAADFLRGHATLVTNVVTAYLAFKTVSALVSGVGAAYTTASGGLGRFRDQTNQTLGSVRGFREEMRLQQALALSGGRTIGTYTAALATLQARSPAAAAMGETYRRIGTDMTLAGRQMSALGQTAGGLQGRLVSAAGAATTFGAGAAGVAAAGARGFSTAIGGVVNALGGPWLLVIAAAAVVVIGITKEMHKASDQQLVLSQSAKDAAISQRELATALRTSQGTVSDSVLTSLSGQIDALVDKNKRLADDAPGAFAVFSGGFRDIGGWFSGAAQAGTDALRAQQALADQGKRVSGSFAEIKLSSKEMAEAIGGTDAQFQSVVDRLHQTQGGGKDAADALKGLRDQFLESQRIAKDTSPGFQALSEAVKVLADNSGTASDRLSAMKQALDALAGKPIETADALDAYNKQARDTADLTKQLAVQTNGWGDQLVGANGSVNTTTSNGSLLYDALKKIRDTTAQAALAGAEMGPILARNQEQFRALAIATGLTVPQIEEMARVAGLVPKNIEILANLKGADSVQQQLAVVETMLRQNANGVDIPISIPGYAELKQKLDEAKVKVDSVTGKPGIVHVSAPTAEVFAQIDAIIAKLEANKHKEIKVDLSANWDPRLREKYFGDSKVQGPIPMNKADGGPVTGGVAGKDSVPMLGMPGEHVLDTGDVDRLGGQAGAYRFRAALKRGDVKRYAAGGAVGPNESPQAVPFGVEKPDWAPSAGFAAALDSFARSRNGQPYVFGAEDCSGFISELANVAVGLPSDSGRMSTANEGEWLQALGFKTGIGGAGSFAVGWINDPNMAAGGHTAGTLPNGVNVESGGATSSVMYGGQAIGASNKLFSQHASLKMGTGAGIVPGTSTSDASTSTQSVLYPQAPLPGARTDPQIAVLSGKAAVDAANSERNKIYAEGGSAQDKLAADLKYQSAQNQLAASQKQTGSVDLSLEGFFSKAGGILARGLLAGLGLENSILSSGNVYNKAGSELLTGLQGAGTGYGYAPQNVPSIVTTVTPQSSVASSSPAGAKPVPSAAGHTWDPNQGAEQWRGEVQRVLTGTSRATTLADITIAQIQIESGGNPTITNDYDINAQNGDPSKGLLQMIGATFAANQDPRFPGSVTDPAPNIAAAFNYVDKQYGGAQNIWPKQLGYDSGGIASGVGLMLKQVIAPERVLDPHQTENFEQMLPLMESINASGTWPQPAGMGSVPFAGPAAHSQGGDYSTHIHDPRVANLDDLVALAERENSRKAMGMLAAR